MGTPKNEIPASEKVEIIRLVENSQQPVKKTLEQIGVSRPSFYRGYDLYRRFGEAALEDRRGGSGRGWNRIPKAVRDQVLEMALDQPEPSPRDLAVTFTDEKRYFVSEVRVRPDTIRAFQTVRDGLKQYIISQKQYVSA